MNKLALAGTAWVASDTHLGPATPVTAEAFEAFLDAAVSEASALLLPGDIFDAWIGDDAIRQAPPWLASILLVGFLGTTTIPLLLLLLWQFHNRLTETLAAPIATCASSAAISSSRKSASERPRARAIAARLRMRVSSPAGTISLAPPLGRCSPH